MVLGIKIEAGSSVHTLISGTNIHGCIFLMIREGGGGKLRINLRKVKNLVNNASILAIFSLKLWNFLQNFL